MPKMMSLKSLVVLAFLAISGIDAGPCKPGSSSDETSLASSTSTTDTDADANSSASTSTLPESTESSIATLETISTSESIESSTTTTTSETSTLETSTSTTAAAPTYTGVATYYDATGYTMCFEYHEATELIVSVSERLFDAETVCGRHMHITGPHGSAVLKVVDKCSSCTNYYDVDLSTAAFEQVVGELDVTLAEVSWYWV